jgi:hypothetical protein
MSRRCVLIGFLCFAINLACRYYCSSLNGLRFYDGASKSFRVVAVIAVPAELSFVDIFTAVAGDAVFCCFWPCA